MLVFPPATPWWIGTKRTGSGALTVCLSPAAYIPEFFPDAVWFFSSPGEQDHNT